MSPLPLVLDPPLVQWEPGQEEGCLVEVDEQDPKGGVHAEGGEGRDHGRGTDEEGDEVGHRGDGDRNTGVLHRQSEPRGPET